MKNRILSDFYFGNINPSDRQIVKGSETAKATAELADAESKLRGMLGSEALNQLELLIQVQITLSAIAAKSAYIDGFQTGARFMMDVLDDSDDELRPIVKG